MNFLDPRSMVGVDQIIAILDYMKDNPQLAHSRFTRTKEGRSLLKRHWAACADLTNNVSANCTQKTPDQWRSYYNAYKSKVKKKVKDMKAEMAATGAPVKNRLTDLENRLYLILGPDLGEQLPRVCNTPVSLQRLEPEHQPSSSTAEVLVQDDTNFTVGSDSSDVELYYPEEDSGHLAADPVGNMGQLASESVVHNIQQLGSVVHNVEPLGSVVHNVESLGSVVHNVQSLGSVVHNVQSLGSVVHNVQPLGSVVHNVQPLGSVVHNVQPLGSVVHNVQPLGSVVHNVQPLGSVVHNVQPLGSVVHNVQPLGSVVHNVQPLGDVVHNVQQPERIVQIDQQLEPTVHTGQQPERMVRSGQIKTENVEGSPRRLRCRASSELDGDSAIREATDALLNVERMKTETKRHFTAALHRLAGAMEAVAEKLGGQVTSPPRARRRYARISSSESD